MARLDVVMVQMNPRVGDIDANVTAVIEQSRLALQAHAVQLLLFPELVLTGCLPEDLLLRASMALRIERALDRLCRELPPQLWVVLGYPREGAHGLRNVASLLHGGKVVAEYAKIELSHDPIFDEGRYFSAGGAPCVVAIEGFRVALSVGEDALFDRPMELARQAGAELVLNISAAPFQLESYLGHSAIVERRATAAGLGVICVNQVGGHDELVFAGASMAIGADGTLAVLAPSFEAGLSPVRVLRDAAGRAGFAPGRVEPLLERHAAVYAALVTGVRDYVDRNRFKGVVLGLSGGIDSALVLAIAVDALGPERVEAVMMPFHYTSGMSIEDATAQAATLGVRFRVLPIAAMVDAFMAALDGETSGSTADVTAQNIQARCRGVLLMAISNTKGSLVLTTGNKSELAVGYSTLYGDMAGGFDVLKDVSKTLVFELARHRNGVSAAIPQRVIDRPPSAELAPDQKDEDSLPPYALLDRILERYVEREMSANAIIDEGFDPDTVYRVVRMVDMNEYKRRQAPIGVRITRKAFGRDRRYPITSGWQPGD